MKAQQSAYINAVSAYNKSLQNAANLNDKSTSVESFSNTLNNTSLAGIVNPHNAVTANDGVIKWLGERFDANKDKIKKSEKITRKALVKDASLTDMVTALSEAELALQTIINIRDKVISAYQDIIKMQI